VQSATVRVRSGTLGDDVHPSEEHARRHAEEASGGYTPVRDLAVQGGRQRARDYVSANGVCAICIGTIAKRALEVHYQPIVDLHSGGVIGVEALARFAHRPVRPPDAWFLEASSVGLGIELEVVALELALQQMHRLPPEIYMSLNVSVEALMSDAFQEILEDVPAERIVLEVTEHIPIDDYAAFGKSIEGLRSEGVRLAVDDAGAGFASLRHVVDFQPEIIKLDIGLIRGIDADPARQALARALLTFARETYDATVVAEGIETAGELEMLRQLGCPQGQGFLLGRPARLSLRLPVPAVGDLLSIPDGALTPALTSQSLNRYLAALR
jgi:EAL domain-containing protein (putative c-di-GMP-specific phosphodiesterase class I)